MEVISQEHVKLESGKNESEYSTSFYIKVGMRIALAEMTIMDKEMALSYLELAKVLPEEKNKILQVVDKSDKVMFFNRLNVPAPLRGNGYGKILLKNVLDYCEEKSIFLINTASNYGEMGQKNLINFYEKSGMKLVEENGLLIFHNDLKQWNIKALTAFKNKKK